MIEWMTYILKRSEKGELEKGKGREENTGG